MPKTDYLSNGIVNHVLRGGSGAPAFERPSVLYVGLFTSPPIKTGGGVEVVGGGYVRTPVTLGTPVGGATTNVSDVVFPDTNDVWGFVGHFGIFDSVSGGNLLYFNPLAEPRQIQAGERFVFFTGDLTLVEF